MPTRLSRHRRPGAPEATTTVDVLRVRWSNGDITTLTNVAADQILELGPLPPLFGDGFESGDATGWSTVVGGP